MAKVVVVFVLLIFISCSFDNPSSSGTHVPNMIKGVVQNSKKSEVKIFYQNSLTNYLKLIKTDSTVNGEYSFEVGDSGYYIVKIKNDSLEQFVLQKPSNSIKTVFLKKLAKIQFKLNKNQTIYIDSTDGIIKNDTTIFFPQKNYVAYIYNYVDSIPVYAKTISINLKRDTLIDLSSILKIQPFINDSFSYFNNDFWTKREYTWDENLAGMDTNAVFIKDSNLVIETRKDSFQNKEYASGSIKTSKKIINNCTVTCRIKLDNSRGVLTEIDLLNDIDYKSKVAVMIGDDTNSIIFNYKYDDTYLETKYDYKNRNRYFNVSIVKNIRFIEFYIDKKFIGSFENVNFYDSYDFRITRYIPITYWSDKYIDISNILLGNMYVDYINIYSN